MNHDTKLNDLLRCWQAPPVPGNFDQNVWRRIRLRAPEPARPWWLGWVYSPLRIGAAAALLAIMAGGWAGLQDRIPPEPAFSFYRSSTVTGAYLQVAKGAKP